MSEARELPRSILVAGSGLTGVLAAVALQRALPASEVTVVATTPEPAAFADNAATSTPFTVGFLERLGITEPQIITSCGGSHRLITRYLGWAADDSQAAVPYGAGFNPALATALARGSVGGIFASLAQVLADAGRYAPAPPGSSNPLSEIDHALRWNAAALRDLAIGLAQASGIKYVQAQPGAIRLDEHGNAIALALVGNGEIAADLYLDCTGPAASLLAQMPGAQRLDWSVQLPVRQVLFAQPDRPMVTLEDRLTLTPAGWLQEVAGRDGLQRVLGMVEGVQEADVLAALGGEPAGAVAYLPGRAQQSWIGNVIALGDAAALFEPLGYLNADFAHRQIGLLLEMLPGRHITPEERAEFNRRSALMADGARDIVAVHYLGPRAAQLFIRPEISKELALATDQFTRRGRLPFFEESPLLEQERAALYMALGMERGVPSQGHQQDERAEAMFADKAKAALQAAPPYPQWLSGIVQQARAPQGQVTP